jgi:hypothetical protein
MYAYAHSYYAYVTQVVKRLPYPYRSIVDAGVVAGLTWGSVSIAVHYIRAVVFNVDPGVDACLPEPRT